MLDLAYTSIAILSAFFAAVANVLARVLLKEIKSKEIMGINFLTMGATLMLLSPLFYHFDASYLSVGLLILIAGIDTVANYFYFKTFEQTEASVATPILSLAPGFTFLFSWLALQEVVSWKTLILSVGVIFLVVIFSVNFKDNKRFKAVTLVPAMLASLLFGISAIPSKYLLSSLQVINSPTLYMYRAGFIALFALLFFGFSVRSLTTSQFRKIFFRGLVVIAQWLLLYYALSKGSTGVAITLGNITPIFVFIICVIFLREKLTWKKIITAGLILISSLII